MKILRNCETDFVGEYCTGAVLSSDGSPEPLTYTCNAGKQLIETQNFSFNIQNLSLIINYEYSPFGNITRTTVDIASRFAFRFSSEYFDTETGLVYYNFRYCSPELGRWLSRDSIGERGGVNLYAMVDNKVVNNWDLLGNNDYSFNPHYDPDKWNDGGIIQGSNNCYSYACDNPYGDKPQPGGKPPKIPFKCSEILNTAKSDGAVSPDKDGCCPDGYYKISLVIAPLLSVFQPHAIDYHWYRLDDNGFWFHKRGHKKVTNVDAFGHIISNLQNTDRDYTKTGGFNYSKFCGYLCVKGHK